MSFPQDFGHARVDHFLHNIRRFTLAARTKCLHHRVRQCHRVHLHLPQIPTRTPSEEGKRWEYKDCILCRVVGTGALGLTGLYALRMARPQAPGSVFEKKMMAGIGVGEATYFVAFIHSRSNHNCFESCEPS